MTEMILLLTALVGAYVAVIGGYCFYLIFKAFGCEFNRVVEVDNHKSVAVKIKHLYVVSIFFICLGGFLVGVAA